MPLFLPNRSNKFPLSPISLVGISLILFSRVKLLGDMPLPFTKLLASGDTRTAKNDNVGVLDFVAASEPSEPRGDGVADGRVPVDRRCRYRFQKWLIVVPFHGVRADVVRCCSSRCCSIDTSSSCSRFSTIGCSRITCDGNTLAFTTMDDDVSRYRLYGLPFHMGSQWDEKSDKWHNLGSGFFPMGKSVPLGRSVE
jgi:hypothetical protein